jgi:hypothetical protein
MKRARPVKEGRVKHVIEHNLEIPRSKQLAERAFADYKRRYAKYSPKLEWLDERRAQFGFTAKGMSVTGTVELRTGALEVDMDVPFVLRVFKQPAMRILDREVKRILTESAASEEQAPP